MISDPKQTPIKTAILLLNMGGPESADEVHPYLKELFQDRELLKLPVQKILGNFIAWRRTPFIQQRYEELGQYSPTRKIMEEQGEKIAALLDEVSLKQLRTLVFLDLDMPYPEPEKNWKDFEVQRG